MKKKVAYRACVPGVEVNARREFDVASSPEVKEPVAVRYGWTVNPECNLYNFEGLPVSPFNSARK
jgi:hypothetical protein